MFRSFLLATICILVQASYTRPKKPPGQRIAQINEYSKFLRKQRGLSDSYTEANMTIPIDHFNGTNGSAMFNVRYLYDLQFVNNDTKDTTPIFFYTGNEAPITAFYGVTGFMRETLAKKFKAAILYVEHRYYGTSLPGDDLTVALSQQWSKYLNVEQAMRDFVDVLSAFKTNNTLSGPTITFGGSYGGMLAAWMRMKYPQHIYGALAASAPVRWFKNYTDPGLYAYTSGQVILEMGGQECYDLVSKGFWDLKMLKDDPAYYADIQTKFSVCQSDDYTPKFDNAEQFQLLIDEVNDVVQGSAQENYPEPNGPFPAWPVKVMCEKIIAGAKLTQSKKAQPTDPSTFDWTNVNALAAGYQQQSDPLSSSTECFNSTYEDPIGLAWTYQTCSELPMPQGQSVQTPFDFAMASFYEEGWNEMCLEKYGTIPNYEFALDQFGGRKPQVDYKTYSNIIFSNGEIDPWSNGGILSDISPDLKVIKIKEGAHHLDLRLPNDQTDPIYVKDARERETKYIQQWLLDWQRGYDSYVF